MFDLGVNTESFNPHIYFTFRRKFDETHETKVHCHDFISMVYIVSGACSYWINDVQYRVNKGDMLVFNPGVNHGKTVKPGEEITELHLGFDNIQVEGLTKNKLISTESCPVVNLQEYEQEFLKCCSDIYAEQENDSPGCELMLKIQVMRLIVLFLKSTRSNPVPSKNPLVSFDSNEKSVIVSTLITFLNENYTKPVSLDTISKSIYLSPTYISKVFKEETGETPINYLIKLRLSKARELLLEGGHSIKSVARSVGYEDVYYFSKLFKKYNSVSPSSLRKPEAKP
ncbi:MAG TPA: AraC family transcriptional regulator [Clostridia bacterium]|nr:AraC family transcriptional regulator [Clostridia bacterium]